MRVFNLSITYSFAAVSPYSCHSGLSRIFLKKDSRQAGMTTNAFQYELGITTFQYPAGFSAEFL
jgi:hypothetical protein